jgi:hypothetical protein
MSKIFFLIQLNIFFGIAAFGQNDIQYNQLISDAVKLYEKRQFESSVFKFEEAFKIKKDNPIDLYNSACSAAQSGDSIKSFKFLFLAIDNGYDDITQIEKDCDLYNLHHLSNWNNIISRAKENKSKNKSDEETLNDVIKYIETNNVENLLNLCSPDFKEKSGKDSIKLFADNIYKLLKLYNLNFSDLPKNQTSTTNISKLNFTFSNWNREENKTVSYILTPELLGKNTKDYFLKQFGFSINFRLKSFEKHWFLDSFSINDRYWLKEVDINKYFSEFFNDSMEFRGQYGIVSKNEEIAYVSNFQPRKSGFINPNWNMIYQPNRKLSINGDTIVYNMHFVKKSNKLNVVKSGIFGNIITTNKYDYLEIVFVDKNNYAIVSNGDNYGIFKCDRLSLLKNHILKEFKKIK